ncbi:MAG: SLC13 family permease [Lysobacteraceae bacterium]
MQSDLSLTPSMMIVLGLMVFTMAMFMVERFRADVTAFLVMVVLGLTGLVAKEQVFAGFSSNAVISVIATMILGAGLERTGALNRLAAWLLRKSKGVEQRMVLMTASMAGLVSGGMQNPSVTALFLPVASRLSARTGVALSRLLLPMVCAIIMGSSLTMVGNSPLLMLNDLLVAANNNLPSGIATLRPFNMFAPFPVGLALLGACILYFRVIGPRWLGHDGKNVTPARTESYFAQAYGIEGDVFEMVVTSESPLVGMSVAEAEAQKGAPLFLALRTGNESRLAPPADQMLCVGSVIGVMASRDAANDYAQTNLLRLSSRMKQFGDLFNPSRAGISEAVIPPNSHFIGQTLGDLHLRQRLGISVLAINRDNQIVREGIRKMALRAGDMLVFHSIWQDLASAARERDFVVITDFPKDEQRPHKLWLALSIFAAAMALALTAELPTSLALMAGAAAMLATRVVDIDEAYSSISWRTVFLMACLLPLGWAMDSSGTANWLAQNILNLLPTGIPTLALQAVIAVLTVAFSLVMSQVGATVVMVPMALNIAVATGADASAFALVVALSASNNMLSVSNPVLAMVAGPAGYRAKDFLRIGAPLTLVYLVIVMTVVNLLF